MAKKEITDTHRLHSHRLPQLVPSDCKRRAGLKAQKNRIPAGYRQKGGNQNRVIYRVDSNIFNATASCGSLLALRSSEINVRFNSGES